jgi:RNA polymerase sigma factor (sigma-70 family)
MSGRVLSFGPLLAAPGGRTGGVVRPLFGARQARHADAADPSPAPRDAEAFRRLLLPHLDAAYAFARYLCRDATAAEDVVQDAYLRAFRGFHGYRGGDAKAWLFAVVRSSFLDWARGQRRWDALTAEEAGEEIADDADSAEDLLLREADDAAVRAAVEALPDPFREALVLRELQDLSYRQIAEITAAPIGTVMSRLARARRMLAVGLAEGGVR